ncbi:hypothetical protein [Candidatus Neptunichlamydia sp. REUL1]|uniref:hypothetical protein n=1 Tax=Candidatus Neptunichlamydia sp. REUL1 TaxID=3064277 RepID=UPI00293177AC|nr:hypothetical protein [Candidatus Neptunochlamydia sp. REUL1]
MSQAVKVEKEHTEEKSQDKEKAKSTKKIKATIYLTEEAEQAFAELYAKRYVEDRKTDRSMIACEAILDLYKKENESKDEPLAQS